MRARRRFSLFVRGTLLLLGLLAQLDAARADVQHIYDGAGRLVQTIASDGSSAVYQYDAAGNISSIERLTAGELSLTAFSPTAGGAGTQVTLQGTGFSTTPSSNAVSFNGAAATVLSANATKLVVEVPTSATTGPISVTVGASTDTSAQSFTVQAGPTITGFSPGTVQQGASVVVTGTNLGLAGQVTVGTSAVPVTAVSPTSLTFVASRGSGYIRVHTPYSVATSAAPLIVVPAAIGSANVVASTLLPPGGSAQSLSVAQSGKYGVFTIEAADGQYLSVHASSLVTTPANASVTYQIISPTNAVVGSGGLSATNMSIHLPRAIEGTYVVAFNSSGTTFQLNAQAEINPTVSANAVPFSLATSVAGQSRRVVLPASAGQSIGVGLTGCTQNSSYSVTRPDGVALNGASTTCQPSYPGGGSTIWTREIPQNGSYTILSAPSGATTLSVNLTVSQAVSGTLTSGTPLDVSLPARGQWGYFSFMATAGQNALVALDSVATTPLSNQNVLFEVYSPTGTVVVSNSGAGTRYFNLTNLVAGTYRVAVVPWYGLTATSRVSYFGSVTGTLPTDGTVTNVATTLPGQNAYYTFTAMAGQTLGLGVAGCTTNLNVAITQPNGSQLGNVGCLSTNPGAGTNIWNRSLPETGTYRVTVAPSGYTTLGVSLTVTQAVSGTLNVGTPQVVSMPVRGQWAYFSFTATAGQAYALMIDSIATTPAANQNVLFEVYNPSGAVVASSSAPGARTYNLTDLVAGTYKIAVVPWYGLTSSVQLTLANGVTGTLPTDGTVTSVATTLPGQSAYYTFTGTAGQTLGLGVAGCTANLNVAITQPNGSQLGSVGCLTTYPGAGTNIWNRSLPQTGTYKVTVSPSGYTTLGVSLTVTQAVSGTLNVGTPQVVSMPVRGQWAYFSFTATAGQTYALMTDAVSTAPSANQNVSVEVYNPSGAVVATGSSPGARTYNLTDLVAGTYKIAVVPWYGLTSSVQLTLANGATGTLPTTGAVTSVATTLPGQSAYYTFTGTAGQTLGLGVAGCTANLNVAITQPNGSQLGSVGCLTTNPGAGTNIWNRSLPQTGTYKVTVTPSGYTTVGVDLTVTEAVSGTLSAGTPQVVNMPVRGQWAYFSFTATAGQTYALMTDAVSTAPSANQNVSVEVYNPSGAVVATGSSPGARTYNLTNLAAGTYKIAVVPWYGLTSSVQLTLANGVTGTLPTDGTVTSVATTLPGQSAYYTFTATAGQTLGLGMVCATNLNVAITQPNGSGLSTGGSSGCSPTNPGAGSTLWTRSLPQTGTYKVTVTPSGYTTTSVDLTVTQAVPYALTFGTPQSVNIPVRGQWASATFTATAGQSASVTLNSVSTTPSGQNVLVEIYNPSGALVASSSATGTRTYNLTNLAAGTYQIAIVPWYGLLMTAGVTVN